MELVGEKVISLTLEQWALVLTAIAAWVALGISLYNRWESREIRRVEVASGYPIGPGEYPTLILVTFINVRGPTVVLKEAGFEFPDRTRLAKTRAMPILDDSLPKEVFPGRSATYYFRLDDLRKEVQEKGFELDSAYCKDETGHYYRASLSREIRSALSLPPETQND